MGRYNSIYYYLLEWCHTLIYDNFDIYCLQKHDEHSFCFHRHTSGTCPHCTSCYNQIAWAQFSLEVSVHRSIPSRTELQRIGSVTWSKPSYSMQLCFWMKSVPFLEAIFCLLAHYPQSIQYHLEVLNVKIFKMHFWSFYVILDNIFRNFWEFLKIIW